MTLERKIEMALREAVNARDVLERLLFSVRSGPHCPTPHIEQELDSAVLNFKLGIVYIESAQSW